MGSGSDDVRSAARRSPNLSVSWRLGVQQAVNEPDHSDERYRHRGQVRTVAASKRTVAWEARKIVLVASSALRFEAER